MIEVEQAANTGLEICPAFTRWQVRCRKCGAIFYVDTEPGSTGEEILELEGIYCGLHPSECSVIQLV